jgi:hypothetical protein
VISNYTKLGIFLKPSSETVLEITKTKEYFKKIVTDSRFLDDEPHVTLLHGYYKDTEKVLKKFNALEYRAVNYQIDEPHVFYNDIQEGFHTPAYLLKKNQEILNLQQILINEFRPDLQSSFSNLEKKYLINIKRFNYPFIGKDLIAHISVGNLNLKKTHELIINFLSSEYKMKGIFESLFIAEIKEDTFFLLEEKKHEI